MLPHRSARDVISIRIYDSITVPHNGILKHFSMKTDTNIYTKVSKVEYKLFYIRNASVGDGTHAAFGQHC